MGLTLSSADPTPGIYTSFDRNAGGSGGGLNNRMHLFGMVLSGYPATLNTPFLATGQSQVDQQCGASSHLAQLYKDAKAQPQSVGAEIWLHPLAEPAGGTKATHLVKFLAPNGGAGTAAVKACVCEIDVDGQVASFRVAVGDTFAVIATNAKAALDLIPDLTQATSVVSATLTLTEAQAGEHGNDRPIRVTFSDPDCGVAASPGTVTFASGPTTADGTVTLDMGARTVAAALATGRTDTQSATLLTAAINGDASPVTASSSAGVVTLYYRNDRYIRRFAATVTGGVGPQTATVAAGTAGSGVPSFTSAITNLTSDDDSYKVIVNPFTDTTSWGALATWILASDATPIEKGQFALGCLTAQLPASPSSCLTQATSPALNTSELFSILWYPGSPRNGGAAAAKIGAILAAETRPAANFNGLALRGSAARTFGTPHKADRPTRDQVLLAETAYQLAPITVTSDGLGALKWARTTYKSPGGPQDKLRKMSGAFLPMYFRARLRALFAKLTSDPDKGGKNIVSKGEPQTADCVSPKGIKGEIITEMLSWGAAGLYDNAEGLKAAVTAGVNVGPNRIDVAMPFSPVADLDQIVIAGTLA